MATSKLLVSATILGTVLVWTNTAFATAIYDYSTAVTLSFSQPWTSISSGISPTMINTNGTGLHAESTLFFQAADLANLSYSQSVEAVGSAGNLQLTISGQSVTDNSVYTLLRFDFGSTPTNFSMMYTSMDFDLNSSTQLPFNGTGEAVGGSGGTQLLLDGVAGAWYTVGQPNVFYGLTGQHTVRLWTGVEATATAQYPYNAPEPSALLLELLAFFSLLCVTPKGHASSGHSEGR